MSDDTLQSEPALAAIQLQEGQSIESVAVTQSGGSIVGLDSGNSHAVSESPAEVLEQMQRAFTSTTSATSGTSTLGISAGGGSGAGPAGVASAGMGRGVAGVSSHSSGSAMDISRSRLRSMMGMPVVSPRDATRVNPT